MVLLFFALHLRTLSPPLLSHVKQCLLELANLYALSPPTPNSKRRKFDSAIDDLIGLCYFQPSANSSSDELKVAYSPRGKGFNLRDFHYAVSRLPFDSYSPAFIEDSCLLCDLDISCLPSHELLHSTDGKDIDKKIVLISSCVLANMDSNIRKCLLDAADRCVSVEFVFLEQNSNQLIDVSESINKFRGQICDLENCSFNAYLPDIQVFNGLVKRWVGELKTDDTVQLQAHLVFQKSIVGSINEILCKLHNATNFIMDGFSPSKVDETLQNKESWRSWIDQCPVSSAVYLNVTERTSLASLSEVFQGLCRGLYSLNQGLVCWTSCNIETMRETTFHYYYVLQPSDNGLMLLRRLAVAEEILPFPDLNESNSSVTEEIDNKIQLCLQEMELRDYNPVQHIGGFHHKINQLVHESLQSGPVNSDISITGSETTCHDCPAAQSSLAANVHTPVTRAHENDSEIVDLTQEWEQLVDESTPKMNPRPCRPSPEKCLSEEWEQLIVGGGSKAFILVPPEPNMDKPSTSPTVTHKTLDTRTSKILERLGNPKQMKTKVTITPPTAAASLAGSRLDSGNQGLMTTSYLLKPTFQRLKRKQR
ncbi:uncharacterized protein LOC141601793 isoform X2 [Silene latifolia]|uniref:uncharacterized protein LOC141601793 isoform X2 n=1 Tax=Silene latifolia TaxID=37657 RepID=UPI003D780F49